MTERQRMTRTDVELMRWAFNTPEGTFLALTYAEAAQFGPVGHSDYPLRFCGRPCIIVDLPPANPERNA